MYRQQPTWQHASMQGLDMPQAVPWTELIQGLTAIAAGAGIGYALTASPKAAAGAGIAMLGVLQLPLLLTGNLVRPLIGAAAIAGAYFLTKDEMQAFVPNEDDEGNEEDEYEPNDDDDDDDDEDDGPPKGPSDPAKSSPWMKHLASCEALG